MLAWSLCVLCVVLAAASLILVLVNWRTLGEIMVYESGTSVIRARYETLHPT